MSVHVLHPMTNVWHPGIPVEYRNKVVCGDAKVLACDIPDNSIDLIFTDPVYESLENYCWLSQIANRVLRNNRACVAWSGVELLPYVHQAMSLHLRYKWMVIWFKSNEVKYRYSPVGKSVYVPAVVYGKDKIQRPGFAMDLRSLPVFHNAGSNHKWSKPIELFTHYIEALSSASQVVLDPFCGGGTVPAVCKMLSRHYIAFEIDPITATTAHTRVANTQPPLPLVYPEQIALNLEGD